MTVRARRAWSGAAAALVAAVLFGLPGPPAHGQSPRPTHVAVVVDYDGAVSTACVAAGDDGLTTLVHAFPDTVIGTQGPYAGFVITIDGHGAQRPDNDHYWSYWHGTGGGWTYANTGGAGYHPPAGSVDGWSYVDGSAHATAPPTRSYASICAGRDPRPSTPASTPASTPRHAPPATHPDAARTSTAAPTSSPASSRTSRPRPRTTTPSPTAASSPALASASLTPLRGPSSSPAALNRDGSSAAPAVGTAAALAVVLGLGGAAFWRHRRRT